MNTSVKKLTRSALLAALGLVLLYLAAVLPTAKIAFVAVAGLLTAVVLISCGVGYSLSVYIVTALLAFFILPMKSVALLYAAFFGYYSIAKSYLERVKSTALCWILKLVLFNVVFAALWLLAGELLAEVLTFLPVWALMQALASIVFVVYDICFSRLIVFYILKFSKHMR